MNPFASLANRNLRLYLGGQAVSVVGTWMQKAAQAWLVLDMTGSGVLLGVTIALQQLPTLLIGLWGGMLADRMNRRRIVLLTQTASIAPALALGVLTATGATQLWMVFGLATFVGVLEALDKPARHTLIMDLAGRERLTNAVTLNSTVQNLGKVAGPTFAGVLIAAVGIPMTFFLNAASFVPAIAGLLLIRVDPATYTTSDPAERGHLVDGLRYILSTPSLLGPLMLMAVSGALAYEWQVTLPLLAHDTFGGDPRVFGFMFSAMGVGAVVGGLALAGVLRASTDGLVLTGLVFAGVLLLTSVSSVLWLTLTAMFILGAASIAFRAVGNAYLQLTAAPAMRGRVMAVAIIAFNGMTPFAGPLIGWIGDLFGARAALALGAVSTAVAAAGTYLYLRRRKGSEELPKVAAGATGSA